MSLSPGALAPCGHFSSVVPPGADPSPRTAGISHLLPLPIALLASVSRWVTPAKFAELTNLCELRTDNLFAAVNSERAEHTLGPPARHRRPPRFPFRAPHRRPWRRHPCGRSRLELPPQPHVSVSDTHHSCLYIVAPVCLLLVHSTPIVLISFLLEGGGGFSAESLDFKSVAL